MFRYASAPETPPMLESAVRTNGEGSTIERRYLASIARAHGGSTPSKSKDTISELAEDEARFGGASLRLKAVAAIVRFADEISENPTRANVTALERPYTNPESVVHNLYCRVTNVGVDLPGRTVAFQYDIDVEHLAERFVCEGREVYLVEYIAERLLKSDRERRYCQRFFRDILAIERIRATMRFHHNHEWLPQRVSGELSESGYPGELGDARALLPEFNGEKLAELANPLGGGES